MTHRQDERPERDSPERRAHLWNRTFWATIVALEAIGWFLSHQG